VRYFSTSISKYYRESRQSELPVLLLLHVSAARLTSKNNFFFFHLSDLMFIASKCGWSTHLCRCPRISKSAPNFYCLLLQRLVFTTRPSSNHSRLLLAATAATKLLDCCNCCSSVHSPRSRPQPARNPRPPLPPPPPPPHQAFLSNAPSLKPRNLEQTRPIVSVSCLVATLTSQFKNKAICVPPLSCKAASVCAIHRVHGTRSSIVCWGVAAGLQGAS